MMKHNEYFEGILQLRDINNKVLEFVMKLVNKNDEVSVSKKLKLKNGFDLYFTSQKFLQHIGKKLKHHFHGELKISAKLFTRNRLTQKNVYRVNVLFRMSKIKKGDVITHKGDKIKITGIGKKIFAKELKTGKKLNLSFSDLKT